MIVPNRASVHTFVIISSLLIAETIADAFPIGKRYAYTLRNDVFINDFKGGKPIAYRLEGTLQAGTVWDAENEKLLKFTLTSPTLHVRPHKSYSQTEFSVHKSPLDSYSNNDFYAHWKQGQITKVFIAENENDALVELKKGLISLFQYQLLDGGHAEIDVSGVCQVTYTSTSPTSYQKLKNKCEPLNGTVSFGRTEVPLSVQVNSYRSTSYKVTPDGSLDTVESRDFHSIKLAANKNVGGTVDSLMTLDWDGRDGKVDVITAVSTTEAIATLTFLKEQPLNVPATERTIRPATTLKAIVKERIDDLDKTYLGTMTSAFALVDIVPIARAANQKEIVQILKARTTKEHLPQLLDILGAVQTNDSHAAVKDVLPINTSDNVDNVERYLQALAVGTRPNPAIITDLLKLAKEDFKEEKIEQTIIQTIGSLAYRFGHLPENNYQAPIIQKVVNFLSNSLQQCKTDTCRGIYLNGLRNLQSPETINQLLEHALHPERSVSVAAMKALRFFPKRVWTSKHIKQFRDIFYQRNKRFDSSARTLALDILLDLRPTLEELRELVVYLKSNDKAYEVKKYLLEKITMLAEQCTEFRGNVQEIFNADRSLKNYHILGQKGLSTALSRSFSSAPSFNGSLTSIQEIYGGVLKRGIVDMTVDTGSHKYSIFTLGLYAGGLSSFAGGNDDADDDDELGQQTTSAGMEITLQGQHYRPLEFFRGQGELMGHVWSGTASEATPAYTATTVLHDHEETIRIQNGATLALNVLGAVSIDLNGQVQLSLWNKNAHCQVNKNTGVVISGRLNVDAGFVSLDSQFTVTKEPKLDLTTDIDFSGENVLCMQLSQPKNTLSHSIQKMQIIPDVGHKVNTLVSYRYTIPGYTHALNQKNNDMCNQLS